MFKYQLQQSWCQKTGAALIQALLNFIVGQKLWHSEKCSPIVNFLWLWARVPLKRRLHFVCCWSSASALTLFGPENNWKSTIFKLLYIITPVISRAFCVFIPFFYNEYQNIEYQDNQILTLELAAFNYHNILPQHPGGRRLLVRLQSKYSLQLIGSALKLNWNWILVGLEFRFSL